MDYVLCPVNFNEHQMMIMSSSLMKVEIYRKNRHFYLSYICLYQYIPPKGNRFECAQMRFEHAIWRVYVLARRSMNIGQKSKRRAFIQGRCVFANAVNIFFVNFQNIRIEHNVSCIETMHNT